MTFKLMRIERSQTTSVKGDAMATTLLKTAIATAQRRHLVGADPLSYGLAANETALEAVIQYAVDQHILPYHVHLKDVFASNPLR